MHLLALWMSSLETCPFCSSALFIINWFWFFVIECMSPLYNFDINSLSDIWCTDNFSHSISCLFIFLIVSLAVQKLFSLMQFPLILLLSLLMLLVSQLKNHWQDHCQKLLPQVVFQEFHGVRAYVQVFNPFELIFVSDVSRGPISFFYMWLCSYLNTICFKKYILCIYLFLAALGLRCCMGLSIVAASGGYSSLRCIGFSLQWFLFLRSMGSRHAGFHSCGWWALEHSSVVVAHRLSCSVACGIFLDQGSNPVSPALAGRSLTTVPPGKPLSTPYVEETIPSPWIVLGSLDKCQLTVYLRVCYWALFSDPLVYVSTCMPLPYCFNYYSLVVYIKISNAVPLALFFFLIIAMAICGLLWYCTNLRVVCSISV